MLFRSPPTEEMVDIEQYKSVFDDQLVIASIGPGKYGDDIGISIITTECSEIPALNHQNAFNWKYANDDEIRYWPNNDMDFYAYFPFSASGDVFPDKNCPMVCLAKPVLFAISICVLSFFFMLRRYTKCFT